MNVRRRPGRSGQSFVMTAIFLTVLVGLVGLAADVGYMLHQRRRMQTAADSAAVTGGLQVYRGATDYLAAARADAKTNGFENGTGSIHVDAYNPPRSGFYAGNVRFVEAIVSQSEPALFMGVLGFSDRLVRARAVAGPGPGTPACLTVLDPTAQDALVVGGGGNINVPGCDVVVNSNNSNRASSLTGGSTLTAHSIDVTGAVGGTGYSPNPVTGVPPTPDPFASLQPPPSSTCLSGSHTYSSGNPVLNPGTYCDDLIIKGTAQATLNPGLYIFKGNFKVSTNSASASGSDVTFYVQSGSVLMQGGTATNLSAPKSGPWEGILFYQDRADANKADISGGSDAALTGVLYFPGAELRYGGGSRGNSPYTIIVADTVQFTGGSTLNSDFSSLADGSPIKRVTLAE